MKNDEDIFEEALARIGEVTPDFADMEEGARRLVAASDWSRILAHRRRLRAEPAAEEDAVYRHRVDADRQRVRNKFFPTKARVSLKVLRKVMCACTLSGEEDFPQRALLDKPHVRGAGRED